MLPSAPSQTNADAESSLSIMLKCLKDLVTGMKEELEAMIRLEQQVVSTEKQRLRRVDGCLVVQQMQFRHVLE
ncbi:hypothetical protein KCU65_g69, partial [Aureobasidium melanogenum]